MNAPTDVIVAIGALADVSEAFVEIATTLRSQPGVLSVTQPCLMRRETRTGEDRFLVGKGPGFRIEWYADAMLADGRSISFAEEVSWHGGEWNIAAAVTMSRGGDGDPLVELPTRYAGDADDLVVELAAQTRQLLNSRDLAIRLFSETD